MTNNIFPCLWFDGQAAEAVRFYCDVFGDGVVLSENPMVVTFSLSDVKFMALNGGPMFRPNPSVSFYVVCETAEDVDRVWNRLLEGGEVMMPLGTWPWNKRYGWISDRYGISWQLSLGNLAELGQKVTPVLMFTKERSGRAEEAIGYYTSLFEPSSIYGILRYGPGGEDVEHYVKHAQFKLKDQLFMAMDSSHSHDFTFSEGISLVVSCDSQEEIDFYWNRLTDGGVESMCCWLKDRFGLWWQVVPSGLGDWLSDPVRGEAVGKALMKMRKPVISELQG